MLTLSTPLSLSRLSCVSISVVSNNLDSVDRSRSEGRRQNKGYSSPAVVISVFSVMLPCSTLSRLPLMGEMVAKRGANQEMH
jgi:hypothetical protein